jgi:hypothetical protein
MSDSSTAAYYGNITKSLFNLNDRVISGGIEVAAGALDIGIAATTEITSLGGATLAAGSLAFLSVPAFGHGVTEVIAGFLENKPGSIGKIPSPTAPSLAVLAVSRGDLSRADTLDFAISCFLFGKGLLTSALRSPSYLHGTGAALDILNLTIQGTDIYKKP